MTVIEQAIAAIAVRQWGHPSWRSRGVVPTYFLTEDMNTFCSYSPVENTRLWSWHLHNRRQPKILIKSVEHLQELLATITAAREPAHV